MTDLVLYDGVCGLCHRTVQFLLARDRTDRFCFAPLQSDLARETLRRHGHDAGDLDTLWLVTDFGRPGERPLRKSRAVLEAARRLGGAWRLVGVLSILPTPVLDWLYGRVAKVRYRIFGRFDACRIPTGAERRKFLECLSRGAPPPDTPERLAPPE